MRIFRLIRKNWKLSRLMKRLGGMASTTGVPDFNKIVEDAMNLSLQEQPSDKQRAEEELYDLIESDPDLRRIMTAHAATRDTLKTIYQQLRRSGAGQWVKGGFVPAAAIATEPSLDHILRTLNEPTGLDEYNLWLKLSADLLDYFNS